MRTENILACISVSPASKPLITRKTYTREWKIAGKNERQQKYTQIPRTSGDGQIQIPGGNANRLFRRVKCEV